MQNLNGATNWARKTLESDVFFRKPDKWFKIWFFLINRANHKKKKQFERGECLTSYMEISSFTGATKDQIAKFISWSKKERMLATRKTTRGMFIKVLNYDKYQTLDNYKSNTKSKTEAKQKQNRSNTINKNDKNDKNDKNIGSSKDDPRTNKIIDIFYKEINPGISYANKTNRDAVNWFIRKWGFDETVRIVKQVAYAQKQGDRFCPRATTPYQLKSKIGDFKIYFDNLKNNQVNTIVEI